MKVSRLIYLNLIHYWRTNLAVTAGVATAVAVLSGALLVGQSVRGSLRDLLYQRIGAVEYIVSSDRFFREALAGELIPSGDGVGSETGCPIIYLQGVVVHEPSGSRALNVNVYGIDKRFWKLQGLEDRPAPEGRSALVGEALARRLGARTGDGLLLRVETQQGIPRESLYGRRENMGRTIRLVCGEILSPDALGEFALRPSQGTVYAIFVPLQRLQRDLEQESRANMILLARTLAGGREQIRDTLDRRFTLDDLGIRLRPSGPAETFSVESSRIILDEPVALAAFQAAATAGASASGVLTHLANSIRAGGREIPYSVITAVDLLQGAMTSVRVVAGTAPAASAGAGDDAIWLNDWAWRDLRADPGDVVEVDYYLWQPEGQLVIRTARFRLAGVVSIGGDVDSALAPDYPGITDARSMAAWDPPFPLELGRIRSQDEEYWDRYRATPKAFVTLAKGQELWRSRFGELSAVRITIPPGADAEATRLRFADDLRARIDPERAGFAVSAVRERGLEASRGSTDFGEYFVYFSFFLIASALMLAALFFRLGVEQRAAEVGILRAVGFPPGSLHRVFLVEGALLSLAGSLLGVLGSVGYGALMVFGLRSWWIGAVGTNRLYLHLSWTDLLIGAGAGVIAALGMIVWTLRDLRRNSPRALLSGVLESVWLRRRRARSLAIVAFTALLAAVLVILASALALIPDVAGFFGAGFLLLVSILSLTAHWLRGVDPGTIAGHGWRAFIHLAIRNVMHRPGRSLLCVALIAAATFIIVSVEAFRQDEGSISLDPKSGTGGYPLLAQSSLPIVYDPNSAAGREELGIPQWDVPALAQVHFVPFRVRPGDDVSCLNLYSPQEPRILGVPASFIASGRFSFLNSLASTPAQQENPWLLLDQDVRDEAIPAIADANTIRYILHSAVGAEITFARSGGATVRLRLVAALRDSIFQGELLVAESNFLRAFPEQEGFRFFLLDAPADAAETLVRTLEERLAGWGFSVESSRERLAAYHQVENTYLSTFQSLGALGLVLGTVGLATVLLRNMLERRKELALLRAVGYRRRILSGIVVAENAVLLAWGLVCGAVCALLAILPALQARGVTFPAAMVALMLSAVLAVGLASSGLAVLAAFRSPLLSALRSE